MERRFSRRKPRQPAEGFRDQIASEHQHELVYNWLCFLELTGQHKEAADMAGQLMKMLTPGTEAFKEVREWALNDLQPGGDLSGRSDVIRRLLLPVLGPFSMQQVGRLRDLLCDGTGQVPDPRGTSVEEHRRVRRPGDGESMHGKSKVRENDCRGAQASREGAA